MRQNCLLAAGLKNANLTNKIVNTKERFTIDTRVYSGKSSWESPQISSIKTVTPLMEELYA